MRDRIIVAAAAASLLALTGAGTIDAYLSNGRPYAVVALCTILLVSMLYRLRRYAKQIDVLGVHEHILDSLDEGVALADPVAGRIVHANAALLRSLNYAPEDLHRLSLPQIYVDLGEMPTMALHGVHECRMSTREGDFFEAEITVTPLRGQDPSLLCIVSRDSAQRRKLAARLRESQSRLAHSAEHDPLTGLPNRQYLQARLPKLLEQAAADEQKLALFYVDLDYFKNVNESAGHGLGDQLLKLVARRLRSAAGAADIVLRMGGDEFVVVMPAENDQATAPALAQQLLAAVRAPLQHEHVNYSLTASIGIATYPQDGLEGETLLKHADIALYRAKEKGRNCYQLFAADMNVQLSEQLLLEQALRRAIDTTEIHIEYQPVVDLQTGLLVSFEALARWRHPTMGAVPPSRFIPLAERTGLVVALGEQIMREVLAQLSRWQQAGLTLVPIAVNVAPLQFERTDFANNVHETALQFDVDPRLIAFEVTESALLQNSNRHVVTLDTLRHAGSRVYIDDFGTGFSNLSYLKTLPVDALKIDQSFVRAIETDHGDVAIVASIVVMARQMNLDTIAEGIETAAQAQRLRELGCRFGQGFYFSRPMAPDQCRSLLEHLGATQRLTETIRMRACQQGAVGLA